MPNILIIYDEVNLCKTLKNLFNNKGYKVRYAPNGKDGMVLFLAEKPDVVILDMCLEEYMSGLEVLKKIKLISPLCRVIAMSGFFSEDNKESKRAAFKAGADYCIEKPVSFETLNKMVLNSP